MEKQKMKGFDNRKQIYGMVLILIGLVFVFTVMSYTILVKDLKANLGNKALVLAVDITHWLDLDQQEYDRLLAMDFNAALADPYNQEFEKTAREVMELSEIKYVYLLSEIPKDQAKYKVESGEGEEYHAVTGTPLTGVYLLDAVLSEELRLEDTGGQGYTDKSRYTILRPEVRQIIKDKKPAFLLNTDEWGTYITGYAPYFTKQGEFIGILGVDLFPDKYYAYIKRSMTVFGVFLVILFLAGIAFTKLLTRVWKAEERVRLEAEISAQDMLTGLINRRRFMGLLAHEHAVCRREGMPLTLMLADLEDFSRFNSLQGEVHGDQALIRTAEFLKTRVKRGADGLCRFGGDEFGIFLHNTEAENAVSFIEPLLIEAPHPLSVGILVIMPEEPLQAEALIHQLEEAVKAAHQAGSRKYAMIDETQ